MPEKNLGGRPPNIPFASQEEIIEAAISGRNRAEVAERTGLSEKKAEILRTAVGLSEEEFRERHHAKLRSILEKLAEKIEGEIEELSPAQKAVTFGIISDKLNAAPKSVVNALHLHFKEGDRGNALKALLGREGERSVLRAGQSRAKGKAAPVIDAEVLPDSAPKGPSATH